MSANINGADMPTLTVFKMELQRITDMNLDINPIITEYMKSRIDNLENLGRMNKEWVVSKTAPPPKLSESE